MSSNDHQAFQDRLLSAKAELAKNSKDIIALIDKCIIGICVTAGNGVFIHTNEAYRQIYGYSEEDLIGNHFTMMAPSEDRHEIWQAIYDAFIVDGQEMAGEWVVMDKNQRLLTIFTDAVRIGNEQDGYQKVTFVNDLTDLRTIQREHAEMRERYAALMRQPFLPLAIVDVSSKQIVQANRTFLEHAQLPVNQVLTPRLDEILQPASGTWQGWLGQAMANPAGTLLSLTWVSDSNASVQAHLHPIGQEGYGEVLLTIKA